MTDEQMDARLRAAGESWRATNGPSATTDDDFDEPLVTPQRTHRGRGPRTALLASAAVIAAALVAGASMVFGGSGDHRRSADTGVTPLEGTVWRLVDDGRRQDANSLATLYVSKDGELVADDECTVLDARVAVRAGSLVSTQSEVRPRGCTDTTGPVFGARSADPFTGTIGYRLDGTRLTVHAAGGAVLRLVAAPQLPQPTADVPTRIGTTWQLVKVLDGKGTDHPVAGAPTFKIDNGRLVASDGCNTISGPVRPDGGAVGSGGFAISEIACADPTAAATAAVVDAVLTGRPPEYVSGGTTLTLTKDRVGQLTYRWVPDDEQAVEPKNLTGRTWRLTSVAGERAVADASLRIDADNRLTADDGCSEFSATAELAPGSLSVVGAPKEPRPLCAKAAVDQATTFDSFLAQQPALWAIRNGKLLIYGGGAQAFSLVFAPDVSVPAPSVPAPSVTGEPWLLAGVTVSSSNDSSGHGGSNLGVTLTFTTSGAFKLTSHCESYAGTYVVQASSIVFAGTHDTNPKLCSVPDAAQAGRVLTGAVRYRVHAGQLTLTKGDVELTFGR